MPELEQQEVFENGFTIFQVIEGSHQKIEDLSIVQLVSQSEGPFVFYFKTFSLDVLVLTNNNNEAKQVSLVKASKVGALRKSLVSCSSHQKLIKRQLL